MGKGDNDGDVDGDGDGQQGGVCDAWMGRVNGGWQRGGVPAVAWG